MGELTDWKFGGAWPYTLAKHIESFTALIGELDLKDITLVMKDWGGPIGLGYAVEHIASIERLVILDTWAFVIADGMRLAPLLELFWRPQVGEALVQGPNLFVEGFLPTGVHHKEKHDSFMPAHRAPFPSWNSRFGTLAFPRGIPVGDEHPSSPTMRRIQDNLGRVEVPTASHFLQEDEPEQIVALIQAFLHRHP